jgi:hypothetical protein
MKKVLALNTGTRKNPMTFATYEDLKENRLIDTYIKFPWNSIPNDGLILRAWNELLDKTIDVGLYDEFMADRVARADEENLISQLHEWNDIEETYESIPEVIIDMDEMNDDMDNFQDQRDAKENLLRLQASSPMSGGWFMAPRLNIPWSTSQYPGGLSWEDSAEKRADELPEGVVAGWTLIPDIREKSLTIKNKHWRLTVFSENPHLDVGNRTVVNAKLTRMGDKFHTAESKLGRIYVPMKFTSHLPGVGDTVSMIVRVKEADRGAPLACVKII